MSQIKIFALGGLDEDGKNMYVIEIEHSIFIIEAGLKYPDTDKLGIDVIIPDIKYLEENKNRIQGIFITHGHDDVMGALPYILKKIKAPLYCTEMTAMMIKDLCKKNGVNNVNINIINHDDRIRFSQATVQVFGMNHSIGGTVGYAIETAMGSIVYTGEYIVDYDRIDNSNHFDLTQIAEIGRKKVLCLLAESAGADRRGHTTPNHKITDKIDPIFDDAQGRIVISVYGQNLFRIREIIDCSIKHGRKIYFASKELKDTLKNAEKLGYLKLNKGIEATESEVRKIDNVTVIVSASGEAIFRILERIASGDDKLIEVKETDTFIIASPIVPGTEIVSSSAQNELFKTGAKVHVLRSKEVFSMHASIEDLKMMLYLLKPKYYLPTKGEYRQLVNNADIALEMGYTPDRIIVLDNGQVAEFKNGYLRSVAERIECEDVLVDGLGVGDIGGVVINDRVLLSNDGAIIIGIAIDSKTKQVIAGPDVQSRGFVYLKTMDYVIKEVGNIVEEIINKASSNSNYDWLQVRHDARDKVIKYVYKETGKRPMILPVVIEI